MTLRGRRPAQFWQDRRSLMAQKQYYVYIMTNKSGTLYTGLTNNLPRRVSEHKGKLLPGFTARYNISRLIWVEAFSSPFDAIACEKRIKGWTRAKKLALIRTANPQFKELTIGDVLP